MIRNPPTNAGDVRDSGSVPGSGRSPGGGHGSPLQYSCLETSLHRGAWRAAVYRVAHSRTRLKRLSSHTLTSVCSQSLVDAWAHSSPFLRL